MPTPSVLVLTATVAALAAGRPAPGAPEPGPVPAPATAPAPAPPGRAATAPPPLPVHFDLAAARARIAAQLVSLRRPPEVAQAAAAALTAEDLEVLAANPRMMQEAGESGQVAFSIIVGCLIIAGIIALAAASDGGTVVITSM